MRWIRGVMPVRDVMPANGMMGFRAMRFDVKEFFVRPRMLVSRSRHIAEVGAMAIDAPRIRTLNAIDVHSRFRVVRRIMP